MLVNRTHIVDKTKGRALEFSVQVIIRLTDNLGLKVVGLDTCHLQRERDVGL